MNTATPVLSGQTGHPTHCEPRLPFLTQFPSLLKRLPEMLVMSLTQREQI